MDSAQDHSRHLRRVLGDQRRVGAALRVAEDEYPARVDSGIMLQQADRCERVGHVLLGEGEGTRIDAVRIITGPLVVAQLATCARPGRARDGSARPSRSGRSGRSPTPGPPRGTGPGPRAASASRPAAGSPRRPGPAGYLPGWRPLDVPKDMGGEGGGTNPEQLFAVGYAACFESALGVVGRRERVEVGDVSIDSRVNLLPTEERGFKLAVELDVTLPQVQDPEQAARIVAAAHQVCPYSNATRGTCSRGTQPAWSGSGTHRGRLAGSLIRTKRRFR
jgi:lipoyl-dependent peroxiredoxin